MSIVPASRLSSSDLSRLGNNILRNGGTKRVRHLGRANHRIVAAVNRSLAVLGERIAQLHRQSVAAL